MERYHRVGYIKTTVLFLLISLSIMVMAQGMAYAAPQYSLQCNSCHGMPPVDSAAGDRVPDTGAFKGNHSKHLGASAQPADCTKCHNNTGYTSGHRNGTIDFSTNIHNSPATGQYKKSGSAVAFTNQTSMPILGSCSTVNCHFESDTPSWGSDPLTTTCNTCHTAPPSDGSHPSLTGSGKKHGDYYNRDLTSCVKCHPNHTTFDHATSAGNRGLAIQFVVTPNAGGSYSGNVAYPNYLPSQNPARNGNCTNIYCHSNGKNGAANVAPQWGGNLPADCSGCHGGASTSQAPITSGKHSAHINNGVYSAYFGCVECHAKTASNNTTISTLTNHVNGYVDYSGSRAGKSSSYNSIAGTCSSTYCHTDGKGQQNVAFTSANGWRSAATLDCKGCHGSDKNAGSFASVAGEPNYSNAGSGAARANSHSKHVKTIGASTCANCHSGTTTNGTSIVTGGAHLDGSISLAAGNGKSFSWGGSKTCSNISCHFNGSATWGATLGCTGCHGSDVASGTPMSTGKHAKHINNAGFLGTNFGCVECHAKTVSNNTTISTPVNHANGFTDYSGAKAGTYTSATGNCSTVYCHSDGKGRQNVAFDSTNGWRTAQTLDCKGCHGNDTSAGAIASVAGEPNYSNTGSGAPRANSHSKHVKTVGASTCINCHNTTTTNGTSLVAGGTHLDGTITLSAGNNKTFTWTGSVSKTCNNISCHFNGTAQWGATLGCASCHGGDVASGTPMSTGKHTKHINNASFLGTNYGCVECHAKTVSNNTTISGAANHANGFTDYSGAKAGTYTSATGNCSTAYCHSDGKGRQNVAFDSTNGWRTAQTLDCKGCHGNDSTAGAFASVAGEPNYSNAGSGAPRANTHQKHVKTVGAATCVNCHLTTTTNGTSLVASGTHLDRTITLAAGNNKSFSWTSNTKTCSAISCHNNGNATWGQTLVCANCHNLASSGSHSIHIAGINLAGGVTMYNYTTNVSSGSNYGFGCANCHPVDTLQHMNGTVNVEVNNTANVGSLRSKNTVASGTGYSFVSKQCDNVYCHSDGFNAPTAANTPVWGGSFSDPDRCANCHKNSPLTGAHSAHVVGIHYDDIFTGTSGKLAAGSTGSSSHGVAGQATTLNCDICHYSTVSTNANDNNTVCKTCHNGTTASLKGSASIADRAFHVNGRADISFRNIAVVSKAQLRPASFVNYTAVWVRNSTNYKNGSAAFDTAKTALANTMWAAGAPGASTCSNIACHVGQTVHWNDTLTCESCHTRL